MIDRRKELRAALEGVWDAPKDRRVLETAEVEILWGVMEKLDGCVQVLERLAVRAWPSGSEPVGVHGALRDARLGAGQLASAMVAVVSRAVGNGERKSDD